jgi:hypothetical protein
MSTTLRVDLPDPYPQSLLPVLFPDYDGSNEQFMNLTGSAIVDLMVLLQIPNHGPPARSEAHAKLRRNEVRMGGSRQSK